MLRGATWLVMKTEGELQERAVAWARIAWAPMVGGMVLISMATPWISQIVRERWFELRAKLHPILHHHGDRCGSASRLHLTDIGHIKPLWRE